MLVTPGGFAIYGSCTGATLIQEIPDPDRKSRIDSNRDISIERIKAGVTVVFVAVDDNLFLCRIYDPVFTDTYSGSVVVPRMRTLEQCATYFKEQDPDTTLTRYRIRQLVLDGTIPHVMCGNKYLVNLDRLIEYLAGPTLEPEKKPERSLEMSRLKGRRIILR